MPNHIRNIVKFLNIDDNYFAQIAKALRGKSLDEPLGTVDFNVLIPMPEALRIKSSSRGERGLSAYRNFMNAAEGLEPEAVKELEAKCRAELNDEEAWDLGKKYYENIQEHGYPTWYEWASKNWGTEWNAYDCEPRLPWEHEFIFNTAWSGVPEIICGISKLFPDVQIEYWWADEDFGYNVGWLRYENGEIVDGDIPQGGSKSALEMAALVQGEDLTELGYLLNEDGSGYDWYDPMRP